MDSHNSLLDLEAHVKILSSLASTDALKIFLECEKGIENSAKAIKELGLTQKRYYTWIKRLIDAGLVEKAEGLYRHTFLGRIIHGSVFKFVEKVIAEKEGYEVLIKLQRSDLDPDAKREIAYALAKAGVVGFMQEDALNPVRVIGSYEQLVEEIMVLLEGTERSIYLASKYRDDRVAESMFRATQRGVKAAFITERKNVSETLHGIRPLLSPRSLKILLKVVRSAKDMIRHVDYIPFSFMVLDRRWVVVELPSPLTDGFYIGLTMQDTDLAEKLFRTFKGMWGRGAEVQLETEGTDDEAGLDRQTQEPVKSLCT